uniref:glycosyltransferase family 2 protein n=1 Tax=Trichocoleus desertorum TaxID=1481672 RepID=UPI0025B302F1|nr:glycosyltransferase family 2 protein [Trichocoleus desertorum]
MADQVYILIPVHNRRAITLDCLDTLQRNGDLDRYSVVVIDDGSTDGTAEVISGAYPVVTVLQGDGKLWWTGAIAKGMEYAYHQGADYFIWLNDDTLPLPTALTQLVEQCRAAPRCIATGQCYASTQLLKPSYGGQIKRSFSIQLIATPKGQKRACDCMSGNLVCLPRSAVVDIGYPPAKQLPHCRADIVYTLNAKRAGYDLKVVGDVIAIAPLNPLDESWASSPVPMSQRWRQLASLKSNIHPSTYWLYCHQVFGWLGPILFVWVYIKLLGFTVARGVLPLDWLKKIKTLKDSKLQAGLW